MIFANIMQDKESLNNFWKKLLHKYRFVIMTDDSFEEKLSLKLSRLNIFAFCPSCGFNNENKFKFCPQCGGNLS